MFDVYIPRTSYHSVIRGGGVQDWCNVIQRQLWSFSFVYIIRCVQPYGYGALKDNLAPSSTSCGLIMNKKFFFLFFSAFPPRAIG